MKINKAGCILIDKDTKKIALVYRDYMNDYSFPKGHIEENESLVECAIRETEEEIKRKVKLVSDEVFCFEEYKNGNEDICVSYYLGIDDGKSLNDSTEVHDLVWCEMEEVCNKLSYDSSKNMFISIKDKILNSIYK